MKILITGSQGLVGSSLMQRLIDQGHQVVGVDNKQRLEFFSDILDKENKEFNGKYTEFDLNILDLPSTIFENFDICIHTAAQPSHNFADENPVQDFEVNVYGTVKLLEWFRKINPKGLFIYFSTTKVYGDFINQKEINTTMNSNSADWLIDEEVDVQNGVHGIFGVGKLAADLYVQEYSKVFGLKTIVLRPGCITGKAHKGSRSHGFLSYLARCYKENIPYFIEGNGKQVRDQLHVEDLADLVGFMIHRPQRGVYNVGGGVENAVSVKEAIRRFNKLFGKELLTEKTKARKGDHKWNVHDNSLIQSCYPEWKITKNLDYIFEELAS